MLTLLTLLLTLLACSAWVHVQARRSGQSRTMALALAPLGGLREGYGVFVHRLTEASRLDLAQRGLAKLQTARTGRDQPTYHRYGAWQHASSGFHVRGQTCIDLPDDVTAMIAKARETGFDTEGREFDLLADPVSGFVVFSFNG